MLALYWVLSDSSASVWLSSEWPASVSLPQLFLTSCHELLWISAEPLYVKPLRNRPCMTLLWIILIYYQPRRWDFEKMLAEDGKDKSINNVQNNPSICRLREQSISTFLLSPIFDISLITHVETLSNLTVCLIRKTHTSLPKQIGT